MWFASAIEERESERQAGGLGRALRHMTDTPFATISGYTKAGDASEEWARNKQRTKELKRMLLEKGMGISPLSAAGAGRIRPISTFGISLLSFLE